jgi:RNA polymerase sigma-70 factor (ECF subfamily)
LTPSTRRWWRTRSIVVRADLDAVRAGASEEVRGAEAVAGTFSGRARAARAALVGGAVGLVWMQQGRASMVFDFTIEDGKVVEIELIADPDRIRELEPTILGT